MTVKSFIVGGFRVEILKQYRSKTQYEWFLTIFYIGSDIETIHNYSRVHLTKNSAINAAKKAIFLRKPRIEKLPL